MNNLNLSNNHTLYLLTKEKQESLRLIPARIYKMSSFVQLITL